MPTVHQYTDGSGIYLRSNISGRFVTLQVSPAAEGLLDDLGYSNDDDNDISWHFLRPLCEHGHVYTNKSGTKVSQETIDAESVPSEKLSQAEKQRLEDFLGRETPENNNSTEREDQNTSPTQATPIKDRLDDVKRSFIEKWSPTDDEYEAHLSRLAKAADPDAILQSVAHHGTEHPIQPERFQISSQGTPIYSFTTCGIPWSVYDFRTVDNPSFETQLFFEIRPGTNESQSITVEQSITEWHTNNEQFSVFQIDDLTAIFPDIVYYISNLSTGPRVGNLKGNETADISPDEHRIDVLDRRRSVTPEEYGRVFGVIVFLGDTGYGRIRAQTGHTFPFSADEFEDSKITNGNLVSLTIKHHQGILYAANIRNEEGGPSSATFLRTWPEWHDQSMDSVRSYWTENLYDTGNAAAGVPFLDLSEDNQVSQCIYVNIDIIILFLIYSATNEENTDTGTIVEKSVKALLKDMIDGDSPTIEAYIDPQDIKLDVPCYLLSMIDTSIETSSNLETRSDFFNAALQQYLGETGDKELVFRIPQSNYAAMEYIADKQNMSTDDLARKFIEDALRTEIRQQHP